MSRSGFLAGRVYRIAAVAVLLLATAASAAFLAARNSTSHNGPAPAGPGLAVAGDLLKPARVGPDRLAVPSAVVRSMGLKTAVVGEQVRPARLAPFQARLAFDNDALARVHARFPGEVVALGSDFPLDSIAAIPVPVNPVRVNTRVHKGDLLAVVWSSTLGEKKSELADAVSRLRADELVLRRLKEGEANGSVPPRSVWDAERAVEADRIAVEKAEKTLRSWRLTDDEIAEVRAEVEPNPAGTEAPKKPDAGRWARVEVRAPRDGVILEKNVAVGDIVDTASDLFKVGDVSHLAVWAHVYEEDLPKLTALPKPIRWTITIPSRPGVSFPGTLESIGAVIDPNQQTALVTGRVANPNGELKAGQYVTATVELPPPAGEVELPAEAVVEDGKESVVFVQPDAARPEFACTKVDVTRRFRDAVCVKVGGGVKPGDRVVTDGALLLRDTMEALPAP